jgi:TonB family protein
VAVGLFFAALAFHVVLAMAVQGVLNMSWAGAKLPAGDGFMSVALLPDEGEAREEPVEDDPLQVREDEKLVQNHRLLNEERPDEADKVSEFDHTMDKEQRAPNVRDATPTPESMRGDSPDADQAEKDGDSRRPPTEAEAEAESDHGKGRSIIDSLFDPYEDGEVSQEAGASSNSGKKGLRGSAQDLARTFGRRGSLDSLEDVEEGNENLLNTKRTKFASFFNRVRNAVAQHWHPEVVHAARDPYGKIYGSKTRTTRLRISLNQDGSVHRIWVDRPSGVDYLDEEAIRAVRAAAPFTNPPRQLMDPESGMVDFQFNFILMIDGSKRIFRYKR